MTIDKEIKGKISHKFTCLRKFKHNYITIENL